MRIKCKKQCTHNRSMLSKNRVRPGLGLGLGPTQSLSRSADLLTHDSKSCSLRWKPVRTNCPAVSSLSLTFRLVSSCFSSFSSAFAHAHEKCFHFKDRRSYRLIFVCNQVCTCVCEGVCALHWHLICCSCLQRWCEITHFPYELTRH